MIQEKELTNKYKREEEMRSKEEFKLYLKDQEQEEKNKVEQDRESKRFQQHAMVEQNKLQEQAKLITRLKCK